VSTPRGVWSAAGIIAGLAGLAVSHAATMALTLRASPIVAVSELVVQYVPGAVAERAIKILGHWDKPVLVVIVFLVVASVWAYAGRLAARSWWQPIVVFTVLGGVGLLAALTRYDATPLTVLPVVAGTVTWIVVLSFLTDPLREAGPDEVPEPGPAVAPGEPEPLTSDAPVQGSAHSRRTFLIRAGATAAIASVVGVFGERLGRKRRHVEQSRRLLKLPVTNPRAPAATRVGVDGIERWKTPSSRFYLIHTAIVAPAIEPHDWKLRIHGRVDRELTLTYQALIDRRITEDWITLNCVSNPVGGDLIGNAWWSGVRVDRLLAEAGVQDGADAVLQTSWDGWTCGTPLSALTDPGRNAMLAIAMNGEPLPIDHGFPVRMIVPGLYGYVSACKWVTDLEVSRFQDFEAYWTGQGWSEKGPVKIASRIDVPGSGDDVPAGQVRIGGSAWAQTIGIAAVEYSLDGGPWERARLGGVPNDETWRQCAATVELDQGDHSVRVRALGRNGETQTGVERDTRPDGATGWHEVDFRAT
jgi:DMSO/TMAO reductase YedYZ molybdopterin-dependent catalytic subunit